MNEWIIERGQIQGKNDSAIETFRKGEGGAINALVREDIQNSLDAVNDLNKPVKVVFKTGKVETLPEKAGLIDIYKRIKNSKKWRPQYNDEVEKILGILNQPTIDVLKVSDYNTKGAIGASSYDQYSQSTPWQAMTEISGDTQKESSGSAGSFGIGKNANRAITPLRALFFTSRVQGEAESYSQGWMTYASIVEDATQTISSSSYYFKKRVDEERSNPIEGELPEFESLGSRTEPGTDIYIPVGTIDETIKDEITKAVVDNFLVSIYQNTLEVVIDIQDELEPVMIAHHNLDNVIHQVYDENNSQDQPLINYYKALIQKNDHYIFTMPVDNKFILNDDDVIFRVYQAKEDERCTRKAMLTRKIGMKINEYPEKGSGFPQGIDFSAVLLVRGAEQNKLLRNLENPEHNKWDNKDQLKANPDSEKLFKNLKKFMRDSIKKLLPEITDDMAAYGLEDLLTNQNMDDGSEIVDALPTKISKVHIEKTAKPITRKKAKSLRGEIGNDTVVSKGEKTKLDRSETSQGLQRDSHLGGGEGNQYLDFSNSLTALRSMRRNTRKGSMYNILVQSDDRLINPQIQFEIIGDSTTDTKIAITHAETNVGVKPIILKNSVQIPNKVFESGEAISLSIYIDESEPVSFNVKVLGQKETHNEN